MEPVNFQMPGYRINEYLLVLKPQEELWQKILKVKEGFADKYQLPSARYLKPHIARKLKPWQYEQGWLDFSNRQFTGRFIADSMLLLKRKAGEKSAFQVARRFDFMNLPVVTRQGNLFNTVFAGGA